MTDRPGGGVIDAHLHAWDPERLRMAWLGGMPELDRRLAVEEWRRDLGEHGSRVTAAVFVETDVDDGEEEAELEWIATLLAGSGPVEAAVAGWRPMGTRADVSRRLDAVAEIPKVVGLRQVLHPSAISAERLLDPAHVASVRLAGERGLLVELCVRPDQLAAAATLVGLAPDTDFVLDHLGRPRTDRPVDPVWLDALGRLAAHRKLVAKISALIECADGGSWTAGTFEPFVAAAVECFGCDRLLWGSNWPVCGTGRTLADWLAASDRMLGDRSKPEREAILGGNARRIYRFPDSPSTSSR